MLYCYLLMHCWHHRYSMETLKWYLYYRVQIHLIKFIWSKITLVVKNYHIIYKCLYFKFLSGFLLFYYPVYNFWVIEWKCKVCNYRNRSHNGGHDTCVNTSYGQNWPTYTSFIWTGWHVHIFHFHHHLFSDKG